MASSDHAVSRVVLIEERKDLQSTRGVPPVAHQLTNNSEVREDLHAGISHAVIGLVADLRRRGGRRFLVGEHAVAGLAERQCEERRA